MPSSTFMKAELRRARLAFFSASFLFAIAPNTNLIFGCVAYAVKQWFIFFHVTLLRFPLPSTYQSEGYRRVNGNNEL